MNRTRTVLSCYNFFFINRTEVIHYNIGSINKNNTNHSSEIGKNFRITGMFAYGIIQHPGIRRCKFLHLIGIKVVYHFGTKNSWHLNIFHQLTLKMHPFIQWFWLSLCTGKLYFQSYSKNDPVNVWFLSGSYYRGWGLFHNGKTIVF